MYDAGICTICTVVWEEGTLPKRRTLQERLKLYFEERTVGVTRFYEAGRNGQEISRMIRIWRQMVSTRDICVIDQQAYYIRQVQFTNDSMGLPVCDLALEEYGNGENTS